jgi:fucose permease
VDSYDDYKTSPKESRVSPQRTLSSNSIDELNASADLESATSAKFKKGEQQDSFKNSSRNRFLERNNTMNTSFLTVSSTRSERDKMSTTMTLKLLGAVFGFLFNGCEAGFGGWVPAFTLHMKVTTHESQAAYLESIFWTATTIGRVCAVPASVYMSSTILIRVALGASIVSGIIMVIFLSRSYLFACMVCGLMGFSLSSIYPFILSIVGEMGYDM